MVLMTGVNRLSESSYIPWHQSLPEEHLNLVIECSFVVCMTIVIFQIAPDLFSRSLHDSSHTSLLERSSRSYIASHIVDPSHDNDVRIRIPSERRFVERYITRTIVVVGCDTRPSCIDE